jgi:hypothetical protein
LPEGRFFIKLLAANLNVGRMYRSDHTQLASSCSSKHSINAAVDHRYPQITLQLKHDSPANTCIILVFPLCAGGWLYGACGSLNAHVWQPYRDGDEAAGGDQQHQRQMWQQQQQIGYITVELPNKQRDSIQVIADRGW